MPTVTVLYFAVLREQRGVASETIAVEDGTTVQSLFQQIFRDSAHHALPVGYARNRHQARPDEVLEAGDEVAFLPPLGGG